MKQYFFYYVFVLMTLNVSAQVFAPLGAKWTYAYYGSGGPFYTVVESDSIVEYNGKTCTQLSVENKRLSNGVVEVIPQDPIFTYSSSDTVFIFFKNEFRPVYFFDAQLGDTIVVDNFQLSNYAFTGCSSDTVLKQVIDSVGYLNIGNDSLYFYSGYHIEFNTSFGIIPERFTVVEKIGALNNFIIPNYACYTDNEAFAVSCYEDSSFFYKKDSNSRCDYLFLDIKKNESFQIKTYPNPVNDTWYIQSEKSASAQFYKLSGNQILQAPIQSGTNQVDVSRLNTGVYFYCITDGNGKVVKNGKLMKLE